MSKSRVKQAREAGPHGKVIHTDGSSQASPNPHHAPLRGKSGDEDTNESYRPNPGGKLVPAESHPDSSPSFGSKEMKNGGFDGREPKPKGPAAIDRDSDYENPTGPQSTRTPLPLKKKK